MGFEFSERSKDLQLRISKFLDDHVYPAEAIYAQQMEEFTQQGDRWQIPQIIEDKKEIAKSEGLWNLFLPENPMGESMSNLDYAPLAEIMGRSGIASEIFASMVCESKSLDSVFTSPLLSVILESKININNKEAKTHVLLSKKSVVFFTPPIC